MRYIGLDILRAIAVLVVVFHHIIWPQIKPMITPYILGNGGYMAVSLFFVLSGFVISLPYWKNKRQFSSFSDLWDFYKRRFFRLYPLFFISAIVSSVVIFGFSKTSIKETFLSLTTIGSFFPSYFFPSINPVYWSLMLEVQMSVIFPLIIIFSRKWNIGGLLLIFVVIAYIAQLFGWQISFENPHTSPYRDMIFGHLDEFVLGIFMAWLHVYKNFSLSKKYILFGLIISFSWVVYADFWRYGSFFDWQYSGNVYIASARNIVLGCAWFCLIFGVLSIQKAPKWLTYIGAMCFSVYIWHVFVAMIFEKYFGGISGILTTSIYLFVTFCISVFSFEFIEKRLGDYLNSWFLSTKKD